MFDPVIFATSLFAGLCVAAWLTVYVVLPWIRRRRRRRERVARPVWIEGFSGKQVSETEGGKLFEFVGVKNICPDCGGKGFYAGPSGGLSQNVFCKNRACCSGFNITPFIGTCERIGKGGSRPLS